MPASGRHNLQPALDPIKTQFDPIDPLGLGSEVAMQQRDFALERGHEPGRSD